MFSLGTLLNLAGQLDLCHFRRLSQPLQGQLVLGEVLGMTMCPCDAQFSLPREPLGT